MSLAPRSRRALRAHLRVTRRSSSARSTIVSIGRGVLIECEGEGCGTILYAVFPDIAETSDGLEIPAVEPLAVPDSAKRVAATAEGVAVCPMCQTANRVLG